MNLLQDQEQAVELAKNNRVCIITGAPGTGKTTVVKTIINNFEQQGLVIALAAPSGKAAKRLSESTEQKTSTIHRLLEPIRVANKFVFGRNEERPIGANMIVVDETSMIDVSLMSALLKAVSIQTRLLFIGDVYQLPAIGAGNILKDMIASKKIPFVELDIIKRQEPGLIIKNCHHIKNGKMIEIENEISKDFFFLREDNEHAIQELIINLIAERLPKAYSIDPVKDIQVLSPLNEKTELSCKSLNELLENKLNKEPAIDKCQFRIGSKVIQCKNDYNNDVVNGDIGYVQNIDKLGQIIIVEFENPTRTISLPLYENNLMLAYALTVHRYQGSEIPIAIIPIHRCFGTMIVQRNWLYTAISRGKRVVILVGQKEEISRIIARNQQQKRFTNLSRFLN